jgi:hypothetical protein
VEEGYVGSAMLMQTLSGLVYIGFAVPLFRHAARNGQAPERLLGWAFVSYGLSYLLFGAPSLPALAPYFHGFNFLGRAATDVGIVAVAWFTWLVFRKDAAWAKWLVIGCALLAFGGLGISALEGDWDGLDPLAYLGFPLEWLGETIPAVWVAVEGFLSYRGAKKRVKFDLCEPIVANRFLLWCLFGFTQTISMVIYIAINIEFATSGKITPLADTVMGISEFTTIATVWLAFFPPKLYRSWLSRSDAAQSEARG